jgi:hypothetical protein
MSLEPSPPDNFEDGEIYTITSRPAKVIPSSRSNTLSRVESIGKVQAIYDSGKPFFTTNALRNVARSINLMLQGGQQVQTIEITGIDDVPVLFQLEIGVVYHDGEATSSHFETIS